MTTLREILKPSFVKNDFDCFQLSEELSRTIMAVGYPRTIKEGWLNKIICSTENFDISMHITPSSIGSMLTRLNQELVKQEADLLAAQMNGIVNPSLKIQRDDTLKVLERLQKGEEKLFKLSLYLNARAPTKEKLELLTKKIFSELNSIMIIPKIPFMKMQDAVKSVFPLREDRLRVTREMTSDALSACFPFTTAFFDPDSEGIMLGFNRESRVPIIIEPYALPNHNGIILGTSGGGKSFTAKLFIARNIMRGIKTMIVDPQGEYSPLVKKFGGMVIEVNQKSKSTINPLDTMGSEVDEKIPSLLELFDILLGGLSEEQKIILAETLPRAYERKVIKKQKSGAFPREQPLLSDVMKEISTAKKGSTLQSKKQFEALEAKIRPFVKGQFSFLNRQTSVEIKDDFVCFDISSAPEKLKPALIFLSMDFVHRKMRENRERKLLVIDEAWSLLKRGENAEQVFELIKTSRKFGLSVVIITQEVEDLVTTSAGKTILANTAWKFLARQEAAVIDELTKKFRLNTEEKNLLLTATPGEGLLFSMNDHLPLRVVASPHEYELITTKPEEMKKAFGQTQEATEKMRHELEPKHRATMNIIASEIRAYTDNLSLCNDNGLDIIFKPGGEDNTDFYGVKILTEGKTEQEEEMLAKCNDLNLTKIFVVAEGKKPLKFGAQQIKAVNLQEIKGEVRRIFGSAV